MKERTINELKQLQALPLEVKIAKSKIRIREAYEHFQGNMCVSFSGGKDSTVLLDIVRSMYPDIKAVFSDTGLEYPEIREFVKTFDNVEWVKPQVSFKEVIKTEGIPFASKKTSRMLRDLQNPTSKNEASRRLYLTGIKRDGTRTKSFMLAKKWRPLINSKWKFSEKCCDRLKKEPLYNWSKENNMVFFVGTMTEESTQRRVSWLNTGCNVFEGTKRKSMPLSFWTEQDILEYLYINELPYASVYGEIKSDKNNIFYTTGVSRTGCMFCMFGINMEKQPNRFQQMEYTHPKQHDYCINKLGFGELLDFVNIPYKEREYERNTNH